MHYRRARLIRARRADVLTDAYRLHPERFIHKHPQPPEVPAAAWINKPARRLSALGAGGLQPDDVPTCPGSCWPTPKATNSAFCARLTTPSERRPSET
jgi:hypothetical protein